MKWNKPNGVRLSAANHQEINKIVDGTLIKYATAVNEALQLGLPLLRKKLGKVETKKD